MRCVAPLLVVALALGSCGDERSDTPASPSPSAATEPSAVSDPISAPTDATPAVPSGMRWETASGSEGTAARLVAAGGSLVISIACLSGSRQLSATVPGFKRVESEDRLSIGFGDDSIALAVDLRSSAPGVTGSIAIPADIAARLRSASAIGAVYGSQALPPMPLPPKEALDQLAAACDDSRRDAQEAQQ